MRLISNDANFRIETLGFAPSTGFDRGRTISIAEFVRSRRAILHDYLKAISGAAGRLVFSLAYFVALANTLSISDFGVFATASAAGVMLSRILSFGFTAPLYRIATVKPNLIGTYTAGFLFFAALSLPVLALAGVAMFAVFFAGDMGPLAFALVVIAEALIWRPTETIIIVNNGLNRFGRGSMLVILSTLMRAVAALVFMILAAPDLLTWTWFYVAANAASLLIGIAFFYPRQKLRFRLDLYRRRLGDAVYVAGAEILFYLQMELDKLLVLSVGGPHLAGIYAIIMRLVDLTAIPIRTFSMLLVQKMMRAPEMLRRAVARAGIEGAVFAVSTLALLTLAVMLHFVPNLLGNNVAQAAPLVILALAVPGLRNLVEYQAELLFARGQTLIRAINLALLAGAKAELLVYALGRFETTREIVLSLNWVFAVLYLISLLLTYSALRLPAKRV